MAASTAAKRKEAGQKAALTRKRRQAGAKAALMQKAPGRWSQSCRNSRRP